MQEQNYSFVEIRTALLEKLSSRGCSPHTVTGYRYQCNSIIRWLKENGYDHYSAEGGDKFLNEYYAEHGDNQYYNNLRTVVYRLNDILNDTWSNIHSDKGKHFCLQYVIDTCGCNYPTLKKIKILFNQLYKYALPRKLTDQDYSKSVDINKYKQRNPNRKNRQAFSEDQIQRIKTLDCEEAAMTVLMLIYSGMRIGEFLNLKKTDCHLDERYIDVTVAKTKNGIRKVPIAKKTIAYWQHFFNKTDSEYLVSMDGRDFREDRGYTAYKDTYWTPLMETLEFGKRDIHETRHTCSTLLYAAEVFEPKINRILGHSGKTTAENVYTHLPVEELIEAIDTI